MLGVRTARETAAQTIAQKSLAFGFDVIGLSRVNLYYLKRGQSLSPDGVLSRADLSPDLSDAVFGDIDIDTDTGRGVAGLIDYIETHRRRDFVQTFCRKFLGYALGRSVLLSDQPLLDDMEKALEKNGYRFSVLFETVVSSPQFRKQRGRDYAAVSR